ncbi:hypothetical protein D1159_10955 [Pseudoflavonifractor sp. 524-17]|uniref:DUF6674 family protein n=1 Tax=Pseudoflavonifractor sp. 524-17 TaxID=2304577 RepID=UPI00137A54DB|nr:DUF6674 family protein [Pseudoflavonifractor sp. 524-17]NCE65078.1 hypothetical protein [Pseudoflavonifractor sp. 524-17]
MDPLQNHETIQQFMKLLEEHSRQGQAQDLSLLMFYMDGMTRQFDAVFQELQEVKAQLAQEKQPAVQKLMQGVAANLEHKVEWARDMLAGLREKIANCARNAVETFKEAGVPALDKAVAAMNVKHKLECLREHISGIITDIRQHIAEVEDAGRELRSAAGHWKNAGRALTGRETQVADGGQEGRVQSAVLAPMRTAQTLLSSMNNAALAAIGGVEHLERTAQAVRAARQAEERPSIRRALAEHKAELAAQSAPAPEQGRKAPEAAR